ncbi:hypothetical protein HMPREF0765_1161 [Sphingobacterium spiritivorum ATCC 33300]|uniref:Uncharacterized protein n=1 Tax=Sphingobacterium spiritivorum ATCC 33300 TaxID=525372 RepID=C2FV05_SPHSI|nr:hypothetical protein HMPREF0765_1161 [Sphingobacterium spiritivorum ATCC 33300]
MSLFRFVTSGFKSVVRKLKSVIESLLHFDFTKQSGYKEAIKNISADFDSPIAAKEFIFAHSTTYFLS